MKKYIVGLSLLLLSFSSYSKEFPGYIKLSYLYLNVDVNSLAALKSLTNTQGSFLNLSKTEMDKQKLDEHPFRTGLFTMGFKTPNWSYEFQRSGSDTNLKIPGLDGGAKLDYLYGFYVSRHFGIAKISVGRTRSILNKIDMWSDSLGAGLEWDNFDLTYMAYSSKTDINIQAWSAGYTFWFE